MHGTKVGIPGRRSAMSWPSYSPRDETWETSGHAQIESTFQNGLHPAEELEVQGEAGEKAASHFPGRA